MIKNYSTPFLVLLLVFSFFTNTFFAQIHLSIDTVKMKWIEGNCKTDFSGLSFKWQRQLVVSDLSNKKYQWAYTWDQSTYSDYLFDKSGGDGVTVDTITFKINEWANKGWPVVSSTSDITLTFFEVGNPSNKSDLILHMQHLPEFAPVDDYISGYPQGCSDIVAGDHGLYPMAINFQSDFSDPNNLKVYKQGETYIDQNFGAEVTNVSQNGTYHNYAYPSPFSAHSKYIMVRIWDVNHYDFVSPEGVTLISDVSNIEMPGAKIGYLWDGKDDNIFYAINEWNKLKKYDLTTQSYTTLIDFGASPYNFGNKILGPWGKGALEMSRDNWFSFPVVDTIGADGKNWSGKLVVVNLNTLKVYMCPVDSSVTHLPILGIGNTFMSRSVDKVSGLRYIMMGTGPVSSYFGLDSAAGTLKFLYNMPERYFSDAFDAVTASNYGNFKCDVTDDCEGPGHGDFAEDDQHNQYMIVHGNYRCVWVSTQGAYLLRDTTHMRVPVEYGGNYREWWNAPIDHVAGARNAPVFVTSLNGASTNIDTYKSDGPFKRFQYGGEVAVGALVNGQVRLRRLAATRSVRFQSSTDGGYFSEPHAAISPDGRYVCWTTNQGNPDMGKNSSVFVAKTGYNYAFPDGINEVKKNSNACTLFPNPASTYVDISFEALPGEVTVELFSIDGTLISSQLETSGTSRKTLHLNLPKLANGLYFIKSTGKQECFVEKFLVSQ